MRYAILAGALLIGAAGWPTALHDNRRTSQTDAIGPRSASRTTSVVLTGEQVINIPATVAADGTVFTGTWGMIHSYGSSDPTEWNKLDGKLFAFDRDLVPKWTNPLDPNPMCYSYPPRTSVGPCVEGDTLNGYNGTVEGVAALDAARGRVYVGRGDGKLYAVNAATGETIWTFTSFNALDPADPEGGGEVIGGPLVAAGGTVYFVTAAFGAYETNAIYAVSPEGSLLWRYPSDAASLPNVLWEGPALSPDGKTLYVAGSWGPTGNDSSNYAVQGSIYALHADGGSLKWVFHPVNESAWWKPTVWVRRLAIGTDGTIYAAGNEYTLGGGSAVLFAVRDANTHAMYAWPRMIDVDYDRGKVAAGIALRESDGQTRRVYATSGTGYLLGYAPGGKLVAVDASSGALLWTFDPEQHGGTGAMTGIAVDGEGVIYTGVSGRVDKGQVYAIREDGSLLWQFALGGLLEWAQPVLGPFGDLYVAETRRCAAYFYPVETGLCSGVDINPRLYAILNDHPRRRASRH